MAAIGWTVSALLSVPQLGIYSVSVVANKTVCESVFRRRPISHRQAYLTFINLVVFFIPLIIMFVCYIRIFTKISSKAGQITSVLAKEDVAEPVDIELKLIPVRHRRKNKFGVFFIYIKFSTFLRFVFCHLFCYAFTIRHRRQGIVF